MLLIAFRMTSIHALMLILLSICTLHAFVFALDFRGSESAPEGIGFFWLLISRSIAGYVVEITAFNRGSQTVAGLNERGVLKVPEKMPEAGRVTFDYLPGRSQAEGGLYFNFDPTKGDLRVSAEGYQQP